MSYQEQLQERLEELADWSVSHGNVLPSPHLPFTGFMIECMPPVPDSFAGRRLSRRELHLVTHWPITHIRFTGMLGDVTIRTDRPFIPASLPDWARRKRWWRR